MDVILIVIVDVIAPMIVAALGHGNDIVGVIDAVDAQGSLSVINTATMSFPFTSEPIPCIELGVDQLV